MSAAHSEPRGIPTVYAGVSFRSRLEARWAAMFDVMAWPWEYEPLDLDFYIPDFVVRLPDGPLLVEVKPAVYANELLPHVDKIRRSGWISNVLMVGAVLFDANPGISLGLANDTSVGPDTFGDFGHAALANCHWCQSKTIIHETGHWKCRVSGCYDGNAHFDIMPVADARRLWNEAGRRAQWRAHTDSLGGRR